MTWKEVLQIGCNQQTTTSRRTLLKLGVATAGTVAVPGMASASPQSNSERADEIQNRAIEIRDRTDSQEQFKRYLSKNADYITSKQMSFTPESVKSNNPSTEAWADSKIDTDLVLTYYTSCASGDPYAYFDYSITVDGTYGGGEGGPDQNSIGWADHHYRYVQDSAYHDTDMDHLSLKQESMSGVDWEWNDGSACFYSCGTKNYYVGCKAKILDTSQERGVEASYWDMWSQATVDTVSFTSSGSVQFTFSEEGEVDHMGYQIREDSDAYNGCY